MSDQVQTPVPQVRASNVRTVVAALKRIGTWIKGDKLAKELGDRSASWERKVRRIASVARPVVISYPGSPGYLHADFVTREELEHCINAHRAVAKDATRTANLYQLLYNRKFGTEPIVEVQEVFTLPEQRRMFGVAKAAERLHDPLLRAAGGHIETLRHGVAEHLFGGRGEKHASAVRHGLFAADGEHPGVVGRADALDEVAFPAAVGEHLGQRLRDAVGGHFVMTLAVQVGQTWGLR